MPTFGDPKTFNPITANEASSEDIYRLLFAALLGFDPTTQEVEPGLAECVDQFAGRQNLDVSSCGKICAGATAQPLTADDVMFTLERCDLQHRTSTTSRATRCIVDGKKFTVTKIDDLTIQVVTPEIYAPFLEAFGAGVPIMPKHILEKSVADGTFTSAYGVNWKPQDIVGSGPFRLKEYKPAQYALLERNPYFFEVDSNGQRLPYFDNIIFTVVPDLNAMSLRFLSGESDVDDFIYPYEYDQFKAEAANGKFNLLEPGIGLETSFFWFNENTNVDTRPASPTLTRKN